MHAFMIQAIVHVFRIVDPSVLVSAYLAHSLEAEDRHEREAGVLPVGVQHPPRRQRG